MVTRDESLGVGEYYDHQDYVGLGRRIASIIVDSVVLFVGCVVTVGIAAASESVSEGYVFLALGFVVWLYLTVFKSRRWNLGYRLFGMRILTLNGERPSLFRMTLRSLLWLFGPFNPLMDLLWLGADSEMQSFRDCYLGTCVVRAVAKPIGTGPIHMAYYHSTGFNLMYPRVNRPISERS